MIGIRVDPGAMPAMPDAVVGLGDDRAHDVRPVADLVGDVARCSTRRCAASTTVDAVEVGVGQVDAGVDHGDDDRRVAGGRVPRLRDVDLGEVALPGVSGSDGLPSAGQSSRDSRASGTTARTRGSARRAAATAAALPGCAVTTDRIGRDVGSVDATPAMCRVRARRPSRRRSGGRRRPRRRRPSGPGAAALAGAASPSTSDEREQWRDARAGRHPGFPLDLRTDDAVPS